MSSALLALWIALIAADRIDLAGGHGPFLLTPFLALTPLVVASEIIRRARRRSTVELWWPAVGYAAACSALLCVTYASVVSAWQIPVSAERTTLLMADIGGTFVVALLCADRRNLARVLAAGAFVALVVFVLFDIAEALNYIGRGPEILRLGPMSARFDGLQILGLIPRLPGPTGDVNRAGFVLVVFILFIARGARRGWIKAVAITLAIVLLLTGFSRSATLAALATGGFALVSRRRGFSLGVAASVALAFTVVAAFLLAKPSVLDRLHIAAPLAQRLSANEGSSQGHLALIERGVDQGMQSIPDMALGIGFGNGYLVLQDVFPGNRYGNFHSLYVTMFAESGILAVLLMLVLTVVPLVAGGPWRPLVAGAIAFNLFYQTTTEPIFWLVLAAAWLTIPAGAFSAVSRREWVGASRGSPVPR
jgi:hypothetical protein